MSSGRAFVIAVARAPMVAALWLLICACEAVEKWPGPAVAAAFALGLAL